MLLGNLFGRKFGGLSLFPLQSQGWTEKTSSKNVDSIRGLRDGSKDKEYALFSSGYLVEATPESVA